jgi:AAA+ superfamily predicted ATPase
MKFLSWLFGRKKKGLPVEAKSRQEEFEVEDEVKKSSPKDSYVNQFEEHKNHDQMSNDNTRIYEAIYELPIEFLYIDQLIHHRLDKYFTSKQDTPHPGPSNPASWRKAFADFVCLHSLSDDEATLLLIGLLPHIHPGLFDAAFDSRLPESADSTKDYPFLGGVRGRNCRFFLPTGETALFLMADGDLDRRLEIQKLFGAEFPFWEKKIMWLDDMQNGEPSMHGRLIISPDYIDLLTHGTHQSPQFSISFPAKKIAPAKHESPPTFEQLVVPEELKEQIEELKSWLIYNEELMNRFGMKNKLKKGYRSLFYGPPGTGKTFCAEILGNDLKRDVFKIDLSMVVSKYIGETEKNLELLFARAEDKEWILFFDEADALFGKRTNVRDAHDKYANQEVSYLLQRIEDYNGLVILATNMKNNIDDAFIRRFNSILKFPFPDQNQRALIWKKALPKNARFVKRTVSGNPPGVKEERADIPEAVKKYELTGGNIMNVVHYASIKAVQALHERARESKQLVVADQHPHYQEEEQLVIYLSDIIDGIKRELIKEGKPFSL